MSKNKKCFVVSPIGSDGSPERKRSDQVLKHIISPPVVGAGYEVIRADTISDPGEITSQIIDHLLKDDLVVADLTGHNPNVFYELAVRHAAQKPFIQIIDENQKIPFDISGFRTIHFNFQDLDSAASAREEIAGQIEAINKPGFRVVTPLNFSIDMTKLASGEHKEEEYIPQIFSVLSKIQRDIEKVNSRVDAAKARRDLGPNLGIPSQPSLGDPWFERGMVGGELEQQRGLLGALFGAREGIEEEE